MVCGADSQHVREFASAEKVAYTGMTNHQVFQNMMAVFLAAKEDYEGGYLHKVRDLIQAEVFDSELEQAEELLAASHYAASAVIVRIPTNAASHSD